MHFIDYILLAAIGAGLYFALRHMKNHKGCGCGSSGCSGNCQKCSHLSCEKRKE